MLAIYYGRLFLLLFGIHMAPITLEMDHTTSKMGQTYNVMGFALF